MRTWRRVPPSGGHSTYSLLRWIQDGVRCIKMAKDRPKMVKMSLVGPRWPGGALRWPQAGLQLAQHGSSDGLGGGFQSMTSHKNEQLAINTCEHNVDIGFKPL